MVKEYTLESLTTLWEEYLQKYGRKQDLLEVANAFPDKRSLTVDFREIAKFDPEVAEFLVERPKQAIYAAEQAILNQLPANLKAPIHFRVREFPAELADERVEVRNIRKKHLGKLITVEGLVRKVTEVRPKIQDAVFQCVRCGAAIEVPQDGPALKEPLECFEDQGGCKRSAASTKFVLLTGPASLLDPFEEPREGRTLRFSEFVDTQKVEIQEAPEGLRGGEQPQRLAGFMDDDLAGIISPGDRVILNGILREQPRQIGGAKSTIFDIFLEIISVERQKHDYEEIPITPEDEERIRMLARDPEVYMKLTRSIAPSIYGLEIEKEALMLQLFGGVPKHLPDGTRIRGDMHIILVGDPGCLIGDERITLGTGTTAKLASLGTSHLQKIRTQVRLGTGGAQRAWATRFHRYARQPIIEVVTETGKCIKGTYNHPLLAWNREKRRGEWRRLDELRVGDKLRVASSIKCWKQAPVPTGWSAPSYHHKSWHVKVPEAYGEELASILGYLLGDGWVGPRRVGYLVAEGEDDLAPKLAALFETVFGTRPGRGRKRGRVTEVEVNRTPIARWLSGLREKRVPDPILSSPNRVVAAFLRFLFEADGTCFAKGRGRTAVSLRSSELELLRDVQILLLRWGIHSRIVWGDVPRPHLKGGSWIRGGQSGHLHIRRGESILRFADRIGFVSAKKRQKLEHVVAYVRSRPRKWKGQRIERIVSVRPAGVADVFDIEVPKHHRFIANGIISHNTAKSQLLRYIAQIAPRAIYTSGKSSSAAGLTAAAIKDDLAPGQWTLEAGALVLADKGLAAIDELDKMNPQDRDAMHEAMEQQTISVAKAGITATLQARTSILGAANPKFGRFDPHQFIIEQIDLPPALLSRFDVIFSLSDKPNHERDREMSNHILRSHHRGERDAARNYAISQGETVEEEAPGVDQFTPIVPVDFMRKYIAYAKQRVFPVLTDAAISRIREYYVDVRRQGEGEATAVPMTARQLEAFVRLSEASARVRLSASVEVNDADRGIRIVEYYLRKIAGEGGGLDIDIIAAGTSRAQREAARTLLEIIRDLDAGGGVTEDDIIAKATSEGIEERRAREMLGRLSEQGQIYAPDRRHYKVASR